MFSMPKLVAARRSPPRISSNQSASTGAAQPWRLVVALALVLFLAIAGGLVVQGRGLGASTAAVAPEAPRAALGGAVARQDTAPAERLKVEVLSTRPHDRNAFTQGLFLLEGALYESTGLYGRSSIRQVDPQTGTVLRQADLAPQYFGEGMTNVGEQLVQITWQEGFAPKYDLRTFDPQGSFTYGGEGWGICYDGAQLVMSDGSSNLYFRNPDSFDVIGQVAVTLDGRPVSQLNELECVGDQVYANVWQTENIVRIDKQTGRVTALINAAGLLTPEDMATRNDVSARPDVLNGIAYDADTDTFLITGKLWPKLFQVRFVPAS
jgi:glutaminyl-peptide cyclotransferase